PDIGRRIPHRYPIVREAPENKSHRLDGERTHEKHRFALLLLHERDLRHARVLGGFGRIVIGMQPWGPRIGHGRIVSQPEFQGKIGAKRYELVEDDIITNRPWRYSRDEY